MLNLYFFINIYSMNFKMKDLLGKKIITVYCFCLIFLQMFATLKCTRNNVFL